MKTILTAAAFANAAPAATPAKAGAPKAEDRVAPIFTTVRTDIPLPTGAKRGAKSELAVKLEALEVGGSIGLTNKTKKQISSTISKVNNAASNQAQKKDASGNPLTKNGDAIKDATGNIVGHSQVPDTEKVKEFVAYDTDAKTDPDKATVRIFRVK